MSKTVSGSVEGYVWDAAGPVQLLIKAGTTNYVTDPSGAPLEQITAGGAAYFYHADGLGSTRAVTDGRGSVVRTYTYGPYGNLSSSTGTLNNPFTYAGAFVDGESGLVYLRARYYDPGAGDFLSRDPLVSTTRQAYAYVGDNPLNATDATGLIGWPDVGKAWSSVTSAVKNVARTVRPPDYITFEFSVPLPFAPVISVGGTATYSRSGQLFIAPQGGASVPGAMAALRGGWIDQRKQPSCAYTDSFISGPSLTGSGFVPVVGVPVVAGIGPSVAETWGNEGKLGWKNFSTEVGVGAGAGRQVAGMQSYSFKVPVHGPGW